MDNFEKLIIACDNNFNFYTNQLKHLRITLQVYDDYIKILEKESNELINLKRAINYSGYLTIAFLELSVTLKNLILAKTDWEKIYFIKNSYLVIHETLKLLSPENNRKTILEENINSKNLKELKTELENCNAKISIFRNNENYTEIEFVRNNVAAHINTRLITYYDTIFELDEKKAGLVIKDFMDILSKVLILSQKTELELSKIYETKANNLNEELKKTLIKFREL